MKFKIEWLIAIMLFIVILLLVVILINQVNTKNIDNDISGKSENPVVTNPEYESKITGIISKIIINGENITVLVEKGIDSTVGDKASVTINHDTILAQDEQSRILDISEFKEGDKVAVTFIGPILESYPVQGTASSMRKITK